MGQTAGPPQKKAVQLPAFLRAETDWFRISLVFLMKSSYLVTKVACMDKDVPDTLTIGKTTDRHSWIRSNHSLSVRLDFFLV